MRRVIFILLVLATATPAIAADLDLDILRGSQPVGPATFTAGAASMSAASSASATPSLRESTLENDNSVSTWPVLGSGGSDAVGYGGFVGYNTQWQDLVLGLEGNYTHTAFSMTAASTPMVGQAGRIVSGGGTEYSVNLTGTGQLEISDYASLRALTGWALGNLLPYGFAGLALGRGNYSVTSQVYGQANSATPAYFPCDPTLPTCIDYNYSNSAGQMAYRYMAFRSAADSIGRSRKISFCAVNSNTFSLHR